MEDLVKRLRALTPKIEKMAKLSGTPGVSIGVLHHNKVIYIDNLGFRDLERKIPPDEDTLYYIASLSKAFTAAAVGILVDRKKLRWTTPVSEILPAFHHVDQRITKEAALVDFCSHRMGLASKNYMWTTEFGHLALPRDETIRFSTYLEPVYPFRSRWLYNNWGYGLADGVIEKLSGLTWGQFLEEEIFKPLEMTHTTTKHKPASDNIAQAYMSLADGTPYHVPRPEIEDGKLLEGAAAVQSNVRELLIWYQHVMNAAEKQSKQMLCKSPLKDVPWLLQRQVDYLEEQTELERSYGLGWVRTELPGALGVVGMNPTYVDSMPVVGKGLEKPRLCIHHQGSLLSFLTSVYLLPDTKTAVVVLTNSMSVNDTADWIGELLLETILDNPDKNDYLEIAKKSAKESVAQWPRMAEELERHREKGTHPRPLDEYVGAYYNAVENWRFEVFEPEDDRSSLRMCFQGNRKQTYALHHYHHNTFSWLLTRDEDVKDYGRLPATSAEFYLLEFQSSAGTDAVDRLVWKHDAAVPEGETFKRRRLKEDQGTEQSSSCVVA